MKINRPRPEGWKKIDATIVQVVKDNPVSKYTCPEEMKDNTLAKDKGADYA